MSTLKDVPSIDTQKKLTEFIRYIENRVMLGDLDRPLADEVIELAEVELLTHNKEATRHASE